MTTADPDGGGAATTRTGPAAIARGIDAHPRVAAAIVAAIRLATTLPALGRRSFWLDEVWTATLAVQPLSTILWVGLHDENPPLYNLFTAAWVRLAGVSEVSMRLPSVLASAAAAALLLLVVRRFFGAESALWATLLFLVNPLEWRWAREARAYGLVQLLCVAAWGLFFELFARPRRRTAAALGLVEAVSIGTHYATGLAFAAQAPLALLAARRTPRAFRLWLGAQALAAAACAPLARALVSNMPVQVYDWRPVPGLRDLVELAADLAGRRSALFWGLAVAGAWALLRAAGRVEPASGEVAPGRVDGGASTACDGPGEDWRAGALASGALLPLLLAFVVSQRAPMFLPRYLLFCVVAWVALLGLAVARSPLPPGLRAVVAGLLAFASLRGIRGLEPGLAWRPVAQVAADAGAGRDLPVIVATPLVEDCMVWAWHARRDAAGAVFEPVGSFSADRVAARLERDGTTCLAPAALLDRAASLPSPALLVLLPPPGSRGDETLDGLRSAGFAIAERQAPRPFRVASIGRSEPGRATPPAAPRAGGP